MDIAILVMITYVLVTLLISLILVVIKIERLEKKLHNLEEYLDQLYDRVDVVGREIGKMWIDITKLDKKIEKNMKNKGDSK